MSSQASSLVTKLNDEQQLKQRLENATTKLVVLEFVKPGSQLSKYVKTELENIAQRLQEKAEFYELDVGKFKKYAEKFKVEALPAFVVMEKFVKKRHVVGTDDLNKAIEDAYAKFQPQKADSSANNASEQRKPEGNSSASSVESVPKDGSEPTKPLQPISEVVESVIKQQEITPPTSTTSNAADSVPKQDSSSCSIL